MISNQSQKVMNDLMHNRVRVPNIAELDFRKMTRMQSEVINSMSKLDHLRITQEDADGVPVERIINPEAEQGKYIYYIHGGGWIFGEPAWGHYCAVNIARACKRNILAVDYRLAPEHPFPAAHDDCFTAYQWMLKQGLKASDIVFLGESTGGNLVLATAVAAKEHSVELPAAICSVSPVADLHFRFPSYTERAERDCVLYVNQGEVVKQLYVRDADTSNPFMSPYYADFTGFPPVYFVVSTEEMLFDDSILTHEKMLRQGVDSKLKVWEGMWHTFYMFDVPESTECNQDIADFFKRF